MALGYERPVTYESYAPPHFLHYDSMNIKKEPGTFDYHKRSSENSCMYSSMESKRYLAKGKPLPSDCELNSWVNKHPKHWTKTEVLDWIYSVVETDELDGSKVQGEAYREFTGEKLYNMSKKEFENVDPNYGSKMYDTFRCLINNISFEKPSSDLDVNLLDDFNAQNCDYSLRFNKDILERFRPNHPHSENNFSRNKRNGFSQNDTSLKVIVKEDEMNVDLPDLGIYSIDPNINLPLNLYSAASFQAPYPYTCYTPPQHVSSSTPPYAPSSHLPSSSLPQPASSSSSSMPNFHLTCDDDMRVRNGYRSLPSTSNRLPVSVQHTQSARTSSASSLGSSPRRLDDSGDLDYSSDESTPNSVVATLGSSSSLEDMDLSESFCAGMPYKNKSQTSGIKLANGKKGRSHATKNGNHLWEFVRDLLRDPKTNPNLLKWEDRENGVFRFVQSEAVAQLWGEKKNNPQMTYEKLSRAMRFCRTAGYFDSVPKNGKFPKKLCFMFGTRAYGWKD